MGWGCLSLLKCVFVGVVPGLLGYSCAEKPEEVEPRWLLEPGLPALGCSGLFVLCKLKLLLPFPPAASPKVTLCERAKGQMAIFFFFSIYLPLPGGPGCSRRAAALGLLGLGNVGLQAGLLSQVELSSPPSLPILLPSLSLRVWWVFLV